MKKKHDLLLLQYKIAKLVLSNACDSLTAINNNYCTQKKEKFYEKSNFELKRTIRK